MTYQMRLQRWRRGASGTTHFYPYLWEETHSRCGRSRSLTTRVGRLDRLCGSCARCVGMRRVEPAEWGKRRGSSGIKLLQATNTAWPPRHEWQADVLLLHLDEYLDRCIPLYVGIGGWQYAIVAGYTLDPQDTLTVYQLKGLGPLSLLLDHWQQPGIIELDLYM